jgi:enoyl-CoA hydratase/carnithine racemase
MPLESHPRPAKSAALVTRERDEHGVVRLTLNRPEAFNALSSSLLDALADEIATIAADPSVRVVVLAGAGSAFCAGHDLREMREHATMDFYQTLFQQCSRVMLALQRLPQPVIARVHGIATAAGCQLVGMCDLAVASSAARFATSGIHYGLFCSTPSVAVSRNLSRKQAFEMLVTGDFIDAQAARERGLINRVVAPDQLDAEIARLAASIVEKPASAIAFGKELFYRQLEMGIEAAYVLAGQTMACNVVDDAAQEGLAAFGEKRRPSWKT